MKGHDRTSPSSSSSTAWVAPNVMKARRSSFGEVFNHLGRMTPTFEDEEDDEYRTIRDAA